MGRSAMKRRDRSGIVRLAMSLLTAVAFLPFIYASLFSVVAAQTMPSLCVVDDSGDMIDRPRRNSFNGFRSVNGRWPILTYLLPRLGCNTYCSWTEFRNQDESCRPSGTVRDPRIPQPLFQTSPLANTISQASQRALSKNVFFITNGIDWLVEGGEHAVEMDISGALVDWLTANGASRDVILGVIQDNVGRRRRPNMVIGFVQGSTMSGQAECSCIWAPPNLPDDYRIDLTTYRNPQRVLTEGAIEISPLMGLLFSIGGSNARGEYRIHGNGRVDIPYAIIQHASDLKLNINFRYSPERPGSKWCSGIQGQFGNAEPVDATCKPSSDGRALSCEFPVPSLQGSEGSSWKLSFMRVPQKPSWLEWTDLKENHALKKSFRSFYNQMRLPTRVRVESVVQGQSNHPIDNLSLTLVPR